MDSFNKVISFVLGLVVVLVFFAVVTGKINLKSKTGSVSNTTLTPTPIQKNNTGFFGFFKSTSPTPTPTQKPSPITINTNTNENNVYKQYNQTSSSTTPKSIPATGLPALFIPMLFSGLVGGNLLRKSGKK
jgi:hypothetical protein